MPRKETRREKRIKQRIGAEGETIYPNPGEKEVPPWNAAQSAFLNTLSGEERQEMRQGTLRLQERRNGQKHGGKEDGDIRGRKNIRQRETSNQ